MKDLEKRIVDLESRLCRLTKTVSVLNEHLIFENEKKIRNSQKIIYKNYLTIQYQKLLYTSNSVTEAFDKFLDLLLENKYMEN